LSITGARLDPLYVFDVFSGSVNLGFRNGVSFFVRIGLEGMAGLSSCHTFALKKFCPLLSTLA